MTFISLFTALAALLFVIALIWAAHWAFRAGILPRAIAAPGPAARLRVLQVLPLDARRRLHLVQCDGRAVLLLTGGGGDCVVGWVDRENGI